MKPGLYQWLIGCFAALGSFLFGFDLGVIAEVVASDSFKNLFLQKDADSRSGTVVALFTGGCFVGGKIFLTTAMFYSHFLSKPSEVPED